MSKKTTTKALRITGARKSAPAKPVAAAPAKLVAKPPVESKIVAPPGQVSTRVALAGVRASKRRARVEVISTFQAFQEVDRLEAAFLKGLAALEKRILRNDLPHGGRALALARTKIEEAAMWANRAVARQSVGARWSK